MHAGCVGRVHVLSMPIAHVLSVKYYQCVLSVCMCWVYRGAVYRLCFDCVLNVWVWVCVTECGACVCVGNTCVDPWESVLTNVPMVEICVQTHRGIKVVIVGATRFWSPRVASGDWFLVFGTNKTKKRLSITQLRDFFFLMGQSRDHQDCCPHDCCLLCPSSLLHKA